MTRRYADEYEGDAALKRLIDNGEEALLRLSLTLQKEGDDLVIVYRNFTLLGNRLTLVQSSIHQQSLSVVVQQLENFFYKVFKKVYDENSFPQVRTSTKLALATLGNDAGVIEQHHLLQ